jgi:nitroimidazol reductase NimA-like FMN-containing flavoprotein (pyridoxamine 5'-phosphate oxidase superfamily)
MTSCFRPATVVSALPAGEPRPAAVRQIRELTKAECFELLANEHLGRLAVVDDRGPVVFPVNFLLDRHTVVFRTEEGTKLHAASRGSRACFEVDGTDTAGCVGWSVMVRGEVTEITDRAELARLRELPMPACAPGPGNSYVRFLPAMLTGRRITAAG